MPELWRDLLQKVRADGSVEPPASESLLIEVEAALFVRVPDALAALWREANGLNAKNGVRIWSVQTVIAENHELRSDAEHNDLYMTFDSLLCFAESGNGDLFFFPIQADGRINRPDIFLWDHETDNRTWVASNLARFVESLLQE